jgi:hypothetical protein
LPVQIACLDAKRVALSDGVLVVFAATVAKTYQQATTAR